MRLLRRELFWAALLLPVAACSSDLNKYNPFSADKPAEVYRPANATEYQCEGNQHFYVRMLEKGAAVWLIYPDREVRLDKSAGADNRYGNGIATLQIDDTTATLSDTSSSVSYTACTAAGSTQ